MARRGPITIYLDFDRLMTYMRHTERDHEHGGGPAPNLGTLEAVTGIDRRSVHRWGRQGGVPFDSADIIACALGVHPSWIWGEDYWNALHQWLEEREERNNATASARMYARRRRAADDLALGLA